MAEAEVEATTVAGRLADIITLPNHSIIVREISGDEVADYTLSASDTAVVVKALRDAHDHSEWDGHGGHWTNGVKGG